MIVSPYDTKARYSHKRSTTWIDYKVHLTETGDDALPCLITHVETTAATMQDVEVVDHVHADLAEQKQFPHEHLLDMGYMSSDVLVSSQPFHGDSIGRVRDDTSWRRRRKACLT